MMAEHGIPSDIVGMEREQLSNSLDRLEALPMVKSARCDPGDRPRVVLHNIEVWSAISRGVIGGACEAGS